MSRNTSHPLLPGAAVVAYSILVETRPFLEGRARIISPVEGEPNLYRVRFVGEALPQVRFIHPDWQRDPVRTIGILTDYWRLNCDAVLAHTARIPLRRAG